MKKIKLLSNKIKPWRLFWPSTRGLALLGLLFCYRDHLMAKQQVQQQQQLERQLGLGLELLTASILGRISFYILP